ncbi:MAG: preprotein translocase subunit SecE [Verrucomicrobiota bacterium]
MDNIWTIVLLVVAAVAFGYAWHKGYLLRLSQYIEETREELRKCTWPSVEELKGSTLVVMVSILLLGGFTVGADLVLALFVKLITSV